MASSSVSQDDHDVEQEFAIASRRAKVRSARANRAVNTLSCRGLGEEVVERDLHVEGESHSHIPRMAHAGKSNKGARDRRKLREKRRSTTIGVMHLLSTESTGGSTGEDENEDNSVTALPLSSVPTGVGNVSKGTPGPPPPEGEEKSRDSLKGKSDSQSQSDIDADDEAAQDSSDVKPHNSRIDDSMCLKLENQRLTEVIEAKDRRIAILEMQVAQLTRQMGEIREKLPSVQLSP